MRDHSLETDAQNLSKRRNNPVTRDICKKICFITNGLVRAYIIDENGKDYTWSILFNDKNASVSNLFIMDYKSFLLQEPYSIQIEVPEDTQVIAFPYEDFHSLPVNPKK